MTFKVPVLKVVLLCQACKNCTRSHTFIMDRGHRNEILYPPPMASPLTSPSDRPGRTFLGHTLICSYPKNFSDKNYCGITQPTQLLFSYSLVILSSSRGYAFYTLAYTKWGMTQDGFKGVRAPATKGEICYQWWKIPAGPGSLVDHFNK